MRVCVQGAVVLLDDEDASLLDGVRWSLTQHGHVKGWRSGQLVYLHHLVLDVPSSCMVDHRNRDPLDNRRSNLRVATRSQNGANRLADRRKAGETSRFKGVAWDRARGRWHAWIHVDGKTRSLGRHSTEEAAAAAYNAAAMEAWGEFARLNEGVG